jgi:hypothetical protein
MSGSVWTAELMYLALLHQGSNHSHLSSLPSLHYDLSLHDKYHFSHADPKASRARNNLLKVTFRLPNLDPLSFFGHSFCKVHVCKLWTHPQPAIYAPQYHNHA